MAAASAGPDASLHLAPDRQPHQHPTTQFFTGRMPFLPPNQQRQSTEAVQRYINCLLTYLLNGNDSDLQKLYSVNDIAINRLEGMAREAFAKE